MELEHNYPKKEEPSQRESTIREVSGWKVVEIKGRVDSFNMEPLAEQVESLVRSKEPYFIVDLELATFLSIPFIKRLGDWAERLRQRGIPIYLLKPTEKLKRQIDIFASLEDFVVVRREEDLPAVTAETSASR